LLNVAIVPIIFFKSQIKKKYILTNTGFEDAGTNTSANGFHLNVDDFLSLLKV
jgi:hypothetical protein